jgi:hypothetical protein
MNDMIITVSKDELLARLQENRSKHRETFDAALEGYSAHAQQILHDHLQALREGRTPEIRITISRPEDHTRDYDRIIGMMQMHQGDKFDLDEDMYAQYVDDDWNWRRQWLQLSSTYAAASVTKNYGNAVA